MSEPASDTSAFASPTATGLRLMLKAKPGTPHKRAPKCVDIGEGKRALELAVAAAPEDGKANKAIIAALADALGLRKADIRIKSGTSGRLKIVDIAGDANALTAALHRWLHSGGNAA